jgi:uncharacterized phage protein gp47/JayE
VADFGAAYTPDQPAMFERLSASAAVGTVTFSRLTPTGQAVVPFGSTVQTADGSQSFTVTADATNPAYNSVLSGYDMADTVASVTVPVMAQTAGAAGNAAAGVVTVIASAIPGIDKVANAGAFAGGLDAESDAQMAVRFRLRIASLREGNAAACQYAVQSLQRGVSCKIVENLNHDLTSNPGFFFAVVDDGTGSPPGSLLTAAGAAIDAVRGITSTFSVYAPGDVTATVVGVLTTVAGADHAAAIVAATAAVTAFIDSLALGMTLPWSRLLQVIYDASPDITNVTGVTVNGLTSDVSVTITQVVKAGSVALT